MIADWESIKFSFYDQGNPEESLKEMPSSGISDVGPFPKSKVRL